MSVENEKLVLRTPVIDTVTIATINTDQPYTFPVGTKRIDIYNRAGNILKYAWVTGDIAAANYRTIPASAEAGFERIHLQETLTIYFQSASLDVIEIEMWK